MVRVDDLPPHPAFGTVGRRHTPRRAVPAVQGEQGVLVRPLPEDEPVVADLLGLARMRVAARVKRRAEAEPVGPFRHVRLRGVGIGLERVEAVGHVQPRAVVADHRGDRPAVGRAISSRLEISLCVAARRIGTRQEVAALRRCADDLARRERHAVEPPLVGRRRLEGQPPAHHPRVGQKNVMHPHTPVSRHVGRRERPVGFLHDAFKALRLGPGVEAVRPAFADRHDARHRRIRHKAHRAVRRIRRRARAVVKRNLQPGVPERRGSRHAAEHRHQTAKRPSPIHAVPFVQSCAATGPWHITRKPTLLTPLFQYQRAALLP